MGLEQVGRHFVCHFPIIFCLAFNAQRSTVSLRLYCVLMHDGREGAHETITDLVSRRL